MTSWFSSNPSAVPEWKTFITSIQDLKNKQQIKMQKIHSTLEIQQLPSIRNIQLFLNNVSIILNQIKSYNNQITDFVRNHLIFFIKQSVRIILQVPSQNQSQQRKNKFPLQGLQFIEGLMYLPNIFNVNFLKEEVYSFYCKCIMYYFKLNVQQMQQKKNLEQYQNALYKNYFLRLFQLPYTVSQCQTRIGSNYASITMSVASSMSQKKQSFLQCLINYIQKNPSTLQLIMSSINSQSLLACLSKILMTNGMYNYPYSIKQMILKKLMQTKKKYIQLLSNLMNNKYRQDQLALINLQKQQMQLKIQNILQLEFNIINRSANIYDGIKLFQFISNLENVKDIIYLSSVNVVWINRNSQNKQLVPSFVEEHLSEVLLAIIHKDNLLYKSSSPTIQLQPKISLKDINESIQPLILSLKQLFSNKIPKPQIKHLNLVKILYVMILNRQKYDVLDNLIIKHNILCMLVQLCKKYYQIDILVNSIIEIFKSIFKGEFNPLILPLNTINYQDIKNKNDLLEEKITAQAFKAADLILSTIKTMKSHKDPLFGQFFKLSKVIRQFSRNYYSTIQSSKLDMSGSMSFAIQNSSNLSSILQPVYKNDFIKSKSKEWQQFYTSNFLQLQNNYARDLGKFEQFDKISQPSETQYSVVRFCQQKQVTNSQMIHDKSQFQATIKNSIQILSMKKQENTTEKQKNSIPSYQASIEQLSFKKDKNNKRLKQQDKNCQKSLSTLLSSTSTQQLLTKDDIQITNQPIKIQFKRKNKKAQQDNDSANQIEDSGKQDTEKQFSTQQAQKSFKNFMKSKINQINIQNRQNQKRKKSKTPPKFKSTDNKTPPKMKKWGSNNPGSVIQPQQSQSNIHKNIPKQLLKNAPTMNDQGLNNENNGLQNNKTDGNGQKQRNKSIQNSIKMDIIKKRIAQNKPLPIKIIMVGNKVPKKYKEREFDPNGKDSRLFQWIRT